jgi:hypothetical protein
VTLKVDITNATKGEKMASYPFTVQVITMDSAYRLKKKEKLEFKTGPDGIYEGNVDIKKGTAVSIEVNYRGISHSSQLRAVKTDIEKLSFHVPVYNITDRQENIAVTERHVTLVPKNNKVIEVYDSIRIENSGNSTYVGKFNDELEVTQAIYIPMPRGYVLNGLRGIPNTGIYTLSSGIVSKNEVKPGIHEANLFYKVSSDTGFFDFSLFTQKDAPEIKYISLYFPKDKTWKINTSGLKPAGDETIGNRVYDAWKGSADSVLSVKVYSPAYEGTMSRWTVFIILIFSVLLTVMYLCRALIRSWHLKREKKRLESLISGLKERIADNEFREEYQSFSRIIKGRLKEIKQQV